MVGIPSPFGGNDATDFDEADEFVPENLPDPGPFVADRNVLSGEEHVEFHRITRSVFEQRGVIDATFGYNLAQLNLDPRHPGAGYRYAVDESEPGVLFAEFTPTTPFCPQSESLTVGSFRAWNDLSERHEYDLVRVRLHSMHENAVAVNHRLAEIEERYRKTGTLSDSTGNEVSPSPGRNLSDGGDTSLPF